jgi:ABC-type uncharacterized transport system auxiliary subunit
MQRTTTLVSLALAAALSACASSRPQQPTTQAPPPQSPIATRHPFELTGKVASVGEGILGVGRSLTIAREDAPPAVLRVADETRIVVDGRVSKLAELRAGDDVKALFDFDKSTPVALQIEAKPHR